MKTDDDHENQNEKDRDAGQDHLPEEDQPVDGTDGALQILPIEALDQLLPVVVQEEDEEEYDGYDDVVEEPPLHNLHVGGGWQGFVHVGVHCVHH